MCENHEHKYRMTIRHTTAGAFPFTVGTEITVYAKGLAEAIAKADGWAASFFPEEWCEFTVHRAPYDRTVAKEHGAILPPLPSLVKKS